MCSEETEAKAEDPEQLLSLCHAEPSCSPSQRRSSRIVSSDGQQHRRTWKKTSAANGRDCLHGFIIPKNRLSQRNHIGPGARW
ncbi:unnamed protein product [Pleuronectes platessa]|uniref:Uncharacterized protein n=1 Tax=Pleuronectes platessa TaxID=8262 RepID=A0A9N7UMV9_PLEPL|nr:unnamed protein product [Pleuronectes platessa]